MGKYVVSQPKPNNSYLAWISIFLLTFNVYHTTLMNILGMYSQLSTVMIQGAAVALLLLYLIVEKKLNLLSVRFGSIEYLMMLSLAVVIISSRDIADNFTYIVRYMVYILVVILIKYDKKLMHIAFVCLLIAGLLHILFTFWFYFDTNFYLKNIFPHFNAQQRDRLYYHVVHNKYATGIANFFSQNGIYMSIALCCTYTLLYGRKSARERLFFLGLFLLNAVALFMTGKRAVVIFACFAMVATYMICGKQKAGSRFIATIFATITGILLLYVLSFYNEGVAATFARFFKMMENAGNYDISTGRFDLYRWSWEFFLDNPIMGIGWREFTKEVSVYFHGSSDLMDAHNVILQLLCETGLAGCGVFVALFATALFKTIGYAVASNREESEMPESDRKMLVFSLCYQIYFLGYCMTGNPLYDLETLFGYMIALGFVICLDYRYGWRASVYPNEKPKSKYILSGR